MSAYITGSVKAVPVIAAADAAALRTININYLQDGSLVFLPGPIWFRWDPNETGADDGEEFIKPTVAGASGRFSRHIRYVRDDINFSTTKAGLILINRTTLTDVEQQANTPVLYLQGGYYNIGNSTGYPYQWAIQGVNDNINPGMLLFSYLDGVGGGLVERIRMWADSGIEADYARYMRVDGRIGVLNLGTTNYTTSVKIGWSGALADFNGQRVTNAATPTQPSDLATKSYVDSVAAGLDPKASVLAVATSSLTLSGLAQTADGVALNTIGKRVLTTAQASGIDNCIWLVQSGAWTRPSDFPAGGSAAGVYVFIEQGTTFADSGWVCTSNVGSDVIGTNTLAWSQFTGLGQITAGAGLTKTGNTLDVVANADGSIVVNANDIQVGTIGAAQHGNQTNTGLHALASGSGHGFMSSTDFTTLANRVATATPTRICERDGSGGAAFAYVQGGAVGTTYSGTGIYRTGRNVTMLAGRNAGDTQNVSVIAIATDITIGDTANGAGVTINAGPGSDVILGPSGGSATIRATTLNNTILGSSTGTFGGGRFCTLFANSSSIPTGQPGGVPTGGSVVFNTSTRGLEGITPLGVFGTIVPESNVAVEVQRRTVIRYLRTVDGGAPVTQTIYDFGTVAEGYCMFVKAEWQMHVLLSSSVNSYVKWAQYDRTGVGSVLAMTGAALSMFEQEDDIIPLTGLTFTANNPIATVTGKASTTIDWICVITYTLWKPPTS